MSKTYKFKVGDKVLITENCDDHGEVVTVTEIGISGAYDIKVEHNVGYYLQYEIFHSDNLKLYVIKNTALARKMYPNHKIIDEDWIYRNGGKDD